LPEKQEKGISFFQLRKGAPFTERGGSKYRTRETKKREKVGNSHFTKKYYSDFPEREKMAASKTESLKRGRLQLKTRGGDTL